MSAMVISVMVVIAGLFLTLSIYNYLSGRRWVIDIYQRWRLSRQTLQDLDAQWQTNQRRSDIVVCLTTTPTRLGAIDDTLKSLLAQSCAPRRIRLHVPRESKREGRAYDIPPHLLGLKGLEIVSCANDYGPATKLLGALADVPDDTRLLIVDDDMIYPPTLVEHFDRAKSPGEKPAVLASSGWLAPHDLVDRPTTLWSNLRSLPPTPCKAPRVRRPVRVDIVQGYSGYLIEPRFITASVFDFSQGPPESFYVDDVWISAHLSVPAYVMPFKRYCTPSSRHRRLHQRSSLGRINRGPGDPSRRNNTIVLQHFAQRFLHASKLE